MRIIAFISILLIFMISCQKKNLYYTIKKDLLYGDKKKNIYLKCSIDILNENNPEDNKVVYLDNVAYKDSIMKLKQFVDTINFHQIEINNKNDIFVKAIFEDNRHRYVFRNHPSSFANIYVYYK